MHVPSYSRCIPLPFVHSFVSTRWGSLALALSDLGHRSRPVVRMHQTHSAHVQRYIRLESAENTVFFSDTDAVWTTEKDTVLVVKTADCLPLLLCHTSGIVAAIHAGRKGLELGIVAATLRDIYVAGVGAGQWWVYFGPSICKWCYQIDRVINLHMDLYAHAMCQIREVVDTPVQAIYSPFCTACHTGLFYSYRAEKCTERFYSGIMLRR